MKNTMGMLITFAFVSVATTASAQVGKSAGIIDINTASEKDLAALPHMSPDVVRAVLEGRPFDSPVSLKKLLLAQKLTDPQIAEIFGKGFVHLNLNTATSEEIMLIPGAGKKMAHEFDEYRPWKTWAQFTKEIGKYVGKDETARLGQYCFIPMNVNKATDEDLATIPGLAAPVLELISKSRPWKSMADLQKEIATSSGEKEAARITRFLVVE